MSLTPPTAVRLVLVLAAGACASKAQVAELPALIDAPAIAPAPFAPEVTPSVEYIEVPKPLPLPGQLKPLPKAQRETDARAPSERVAAATAAARIEPARHGFINAIQVYPYTKGALYQLYAAINQVSDIALEPGEKLFSASAGDTVRWVLGDTSSGEGKETTQHILLKPIQPDLTTNLVITTDRRTYHLEARSTKATYMASVSWTYPPAELVSLRGESDGEGSQVRAAELRVNPADLHFRYVISGEAPFRPVRVFDDGSKVFIQFPPGLAQGEAPPLFVIGPDGRPALVNYRVRGTTYIVDRLFAAAELRLGTAPQRVVRITRSDARWREAQP
jgi:type IV secretion system protein VirB9